MNNVSITKLLHLWHTIFCILSVWRFSLKKLQLGQAELLIVVLCSRQQAMTCGRWAHCLRSASLQQPCPATPACPPCARPCTANRYVRHLHHPSHLHASHQSLPVSKHERSLCVSSNRFATANFLPALRPSMLRQQVRCTPVLSKMGGSTSALLLLNGIHGANSWPCQLQLQKKLIPITIMIM